MQCSIIYGFSGVSSGASFVVAKQHSNEMVSANMRHFFDVYCIFTARVSSQIISQKAQLRAPLSPCKKPGLVLTLICIVVGHPQQAPLWWKIATAQK